MTKIEIAEIFRFKTEKEYLDEKVFMPVDFDLIKKDDEFHLAYRQYNLEILNTLAEIEKEEGKKVFKYITYQQMADIYINGKMQLKDVEAPMNTSNEGFFYQLEMAQYADKLFLVKTDILKQLENIVKQPKSVIRDRTHELSEQEKQKIEKEWTDLHNRVHSDEESI